MSATASRKTLAKSFFVAVTALMGCAGGGGQKSLEAAPAPQASAKPDNPNDCGPGDGKSESCMPNRSPDIEPPAKPQDAPVVTKDQ